MQQVQCSLFAPPADGAIESIRKFRVQAGQVKFPDGNRMRLNGVRLEDGGDAVDSYFIQTSWLIRGRLMWIAARTEPRIKRPPAEVRWLDSIDMNTAGLQKK